MAGSWLRKVVRVGIATALLVTGLATSSPVAAKADVYTEPGTHNVNGRQWRTTCGRYSSTVERCTTNIWATQVVYEGGRFFQRNAWVFNNLTYKPSARSNWAGNPLATPGNHTIDGRRWYTECDTSWTGRNACRSMIEASVIVNRGSGYAWQKKMVFNNIVLFATPPTAKWYDLTKQKIISKTNIEGYNSYDIARVEALTIGTRYFPEALYMQDGSYAYLKTGEFSFALNGKCSSFEAYVGERADSRFTSEPTLYRFYLDGQQVGETVEVAPFKGPKKITLNVAGGVQLKLWSHHKKGGGVPAWGAPQIKCVGNPNPTS